MRQRERRHEIPGQMTLAWIAMITFFISAVFALVTHGDRAVVVMLVSLCVWMAAGIVAIRAHRQRLTAPLEGK